MVHFNYARTLAYSLILAFILNAGCRVPDYTINVGGNDQSYSHAKNLVYDGATTLFILNSVATNSKAYSLETIDLTNGTRTLVAGTQSSAFTNGTGTAAAFQSPTAMAYKPGTPGYLYIADYCTIRKVDTSTWQVTTIAGLAGSCTDTDGTGTAARFASPSALEISGSDLYIGTTMKVRKMNLTTLAVTTLAGSTTAGNVDGTGTSAKFNRITDLKIISGTLYILDATNNRIRKLNLSNNSVTTLAGSTSGFADGVGTAAQFYFLTSGTTNMSSDGVKYLFINDSQNCAIRKLDVTTATVSTIVAKATNGVCFDNDGTLGVDNVATSAPTGISLTPYGLFITNDWGIRVLR